MGRDVASFKSSKIESVGAFGICKYLLYDKHNASMRFVIYIVCFVVCSSPPSFCQGVVVSAQVPLIGVEVCVTVDLSPGQSFSPFDGNIFMGYQMRGQERVSFWAPKSHLTANISKTVSRSVTCQLELNNLDESFLKM